MFAAASPIAPSVPVTATATVLSAPDIDSSDTNPTADEALPPRWARGLNPDQRAAVEHDGAPLLIVAGAGTGKTRTLVARVGRLIDEGANPDRILLLTFTRRSAAELISRVGSMTDHQRATQIWGGTFHSVANRLLRRLGPSIGLPAGFTVLDPADAADLIGIVRAELGLAERRSRFPKKQTIAALYSRMVNSQAPLTQMLDESYPWLRPHIDDLRGVFAAYTERKRAHQVLDYDDLLLFWRALVASPEVGPHLRTLFDHILVDEYQDTNALQSDIVFGTTGPTTQVTVVGDDAQAIYGFRAATVANLWAFAERFEGAVTTKLEQNYRSTPQILHAANAMLAESDVHIAKRLWTERDGGRQPELITAHDEAAQSNLVCDQILALREEGVDLRQQAVLYRANHHSDHLELELARRDIPYVKFGGLKFLEAAHVKDLLAALRVLDNPSDQLAWYRVLGMLEGVGPATTKRIADSLGIADGEPEALDRFLSSPPQVPPAAADGVTELREAMADCEVGDLTPAEQIERLLRFFAMVFPRRYPDSVVRLGDLEQLQTTAGAYHDRSRFLTEVTLDPPDRSSDLAGPPHVDDDWITLSTIHSAKGCEWEAVHLIHAADGNLPADMALSDSDGLEEERRLLYVAMTRARDVLNISFPLRYHTRRYGRDDDYQLAPVSRFLEPVRSAFHEWGSSPQQATADELLLELTSVTVVDEVDNGVAALWGS